MPKMIFVQMPDGNGDGLRYVGAAGAVIGLKLVPVLLMGVVLLAVLPERQRACAWKSYFQPWSAGLTVRVRVVDHVLQSDHVPSVVVAVLR